MVAYLSTPLPTVLLARRNNKEQNAEPSRPTSWSPLGHIGATSHARISDNGGQWRSANAPGQHRFTRIVTAHVLAPVLPDTEEVLR